MVREYTQIIKIWPSIAPILSPPQNDEDLDKLIGLADCLIDQTQGKENHPLMGLH